ncbi:MAG: ATP-dependent DNA ligase [Micavibrio aeruginosavorus]|uniref:DNA ligase (ATP) n=1 Tax=Micavibrio aeruginosavorus TaxID=349221 RepID=A0A2W4ZRJ5_9BACT|nr:MAG: ATP-dependent DNA ligase [Micavibrio aeruginosavorus]
MKDFAALLENLVLTPARNAKLAHMVQYFKSAPDPDRGYALAVLTNGISFKNVKSGHLKNIVLEKVDPVLFGLSYDYVGDLAETIALIWPDHETGDLPSLSELVLELRDLPQGKLPALVSTYLSRATPSQRWAIIKLVTGNLRVGVSERLAKTALAEFGGKPLNDIEHIWHGLQAPYLDLFAWLEDRGPLPEIHRHKVFHPMMLSNPVDEAKDFDNMRPDDFQAEWKWDGIRVQLVLGEDECRIFSRTGEDITHSFPDLADTLKGTGVLDGELLVGIDFKPMSFNALQQRLNRKTTSLKMMGEYPSFVQMYDILFDGDEDVRGLPLFERRKRLEQWNLRHKNTRLDVSGIIPIESWDHLAKIRVQGAEEEGHEGIMLKRKDSPYLAGRPKGYWYKWKRDPRLIDAVLMYAQRGHGKRSSYYSDYTFGVWNNNEIVPVGKAYSGFTDQELLQLDKWVRNNTTNRFGPVREVKKELVFEVAFDAAQESTRHKSGFALRFPRINRIRWDKPAQEADTIDNVKMLVKN